MAKYSSVQEFVKKNKGVESSIRQSFPGMARTPAQAKAKIIKWSKIVEDTLENNMRKVPKSGTTYPSCHQTLGPFVGPSGVTARVTFTAYPKPSRFWPGVSVNLPQLFEDGYQVKSSVWFWDRKFYGYRFPAHTMENTVKKLASQAAADGVQITLSTSAI